MAVQMQQPVQAPDIQPFAANIPRFFLFAALRGAQFGLITATWVIFLQRQHGLNYTQVTLIDVVFWLAVALGEVPTGMVADTIGRKVSLAIGTIIMAVSMVAWAFAPTIGLVTAAYGLLAIGHTFLSGADDAFFYESLKITGRRDEYVRLNGRKVALVIACTALGSLSSGLLAAIDLRLPFLAAIFCFLTMFVVTLSFREPRHEANADEAKRLTYGQVLRQAVKMMKVRPVLRLSIFYLVLLGLSGVLLETVFLQPQALTLGVPLAAVGVVVTGVHLLNILGSSTADRVRARLGESTVLLVAPMLIVVCLVALAALQSLPALGFVGVVGLLTNLARPLAMGRLQQEADDNVRATLLSLQALLFTLVIAVIEPTMGVIADRAGLSAAYFVLALILALLLTLLYSKGWRYFSQGAAQ
jgi:MFS family permease